MANLDKITLSGTTYDIVDSTAIHSLDGYYTSGQTNDAITAATTALATVVGEALDLKFESVNYNSTDKKIYFYGNSAATGTALAYIDATDFIKDGMVDNVEIKTLSGASYLAITFNSDAGKEEIDIPISDIFDASNYYTKSETSGATQISTALSDKQDTLVSGTNIKTVNNTSLLGSGDITITGGLQASVQGTTLVFS